MTNAILKTILDREGDKVRLVKTTAHSFALNQARRGEQVTTNDMIEYETISGEDFIKVRRWDPSSNKYYIEYIETASIEKIVVTENSGDVLDPYSMQF